MELHEKIIDLYKKTATQLPQDIILALQNAEEIEDDPVAIEVLSKILDNISKAETESLPICQDTGIPIFYIKHPKDYTQEKMRNIIKDATIAATEQVPLRPNAIDCLEDKNIGNNPIIH